MHRWNQKWILSLLLLAVFLLAAPTALATETNTSTQTESVPTAASEASSQHTSSQPNSSSSSRVESSSSTQSAASSSSSSNQGTHSSSSTVSKAPQEDLKLTHFWIYDGAGGDNITSYFRRSGEQINGTVPSGINSISVQAESNRGTCKVVFNQQGLVDGANNNYATITISDGNQSLYFYINVTREASKTQSGGSSTQSKPVQSTVDWNEDGISDASTPSELDSWQATENSSSSEEASSEEASSQASSVAVIEGTDEGGGWMLPTAIILIVLGVLGAAFVVCDILYTKGILKKWILPRRGANAPKADAEMKPEQEPDQLDRTGMHDPSDQNDDQTGMHDQSPQDSDQPPKPTDWEDWDEFFRNK